MRSTNRQPISLAPGVYDSPAELAEVKLRIEHWERANPKAAMLSDRFNDLVFFEVPLRELMQRVGIFVRQGDPASLPFDEVSLHRASNSWNRLSSFYNSAWRTVTKDVRSVYDRTFDDLTAFVSECEALEPHRKQIEAAHKTFAGLITDLIKMGYSYSTIAPQLGRRYYRFRE